MARTKRKLAKLNIGAESVAKGNIIEWHDKEKCPTMKYVGQWNEDSQTFVCYQVGTHTGNILAKETFGVKDIQSTLMYNHSCKNISVFSKTGSGLTFSFPNEQFKKFITDNEIC